jgi:hypothetical protein
MIKGELNNNGGISMGKGINVLTEELMNEILICYFWMKNNVYKHP